MKPDYIQDYTRQRPGFLLRLLWFFLDLFAGCLAAAMIGLVLLVVRWFISGFSVSFWPIWLTI